MILVVGLGNPGSKYNNTRHNAGFMALDEFQKNNAFPEFTESVKHKAEVSEGMIRDEKVILAKPTTFMNNSGAAVQQLASFYKLQPSSIVLVHDEIDLLIGEVKVSLRSGSAGHKGVDSVIQALRTKDFHRVRIGIQPKNGKPENVEAFVLKPFLKEEASNMKKAAEHILSLITQD